MTITKAERGELQRLIRQRFRVLRAEVEQRRAELEAELAAGLTEKYADQDREWAAAIFRIEEAAREANRVANDIMRGLYGDRWVEREIVDAVAMNQPKQERNQLRFEGQKRIAARVQAAHLRLDQQEADLLTRLVVDALESEEARAFLAQIPTVSALVPAGRLFELEQSLTLEADR